LSPAAAQARVCGEFGTTTEGEPAIVTVKATGVGCRVARKVIRRSFRGRRSTGWVCSSAGEEGTCTRGRASISYGGARRTRECGSIGFEPQTDDGAGSIKAKRVGCRLARKVARRSGFTGPIDPDPYRAFGFSCRGRELVSALPAALFVCYRGSATVVFSRT